MPDFHFDPLVTRVLAAPPVTTPQYSGPSLAFSVSDGHFYLWDGDSWVDLGTAPSGGSGGGGGLPANASTETKQDAQLALLGTMQANLAAIQTRLAGDVSYSETLVADSVGTYWWRVRIFDADTNTSSIVFHNSAGAVGVPVGAVTPVITTQDREIRVTDYRATNPGAGYLTDDRIVQVDILDLSATIPGSTPITTFWYNERTRLVLPSPPPVGNLTPRDTLMHQFVLSLVNAVGVATESEWDFLNPAAPLVGLLKALNLNIGKRQMSAPWDGNNTDVDITSVLKGLGLRALRDIQTKKIVLDSSGGSQVLLDAGERARSLILVYQDSPPAPIQYVKFYDLSTDPTGVESPLMIFPLNPGRVVMLNSEFTHILPRHVQQLRVVASENPDDAAIVSATPQNIMIQVSYYVE